MFAVSGARNWALLLQGSLTILLVTLLPSPWSMKNAVGYIWNTFQTKFAKCCQLYKTIKTWDEILPLKKMHLLFTVNNDSVSVVQMQRLNCCWLVTSSLCIILQMMTWNPSDEKKGTNFDFNHNCKITSNITLCPWVMCFQNLRFTVCSLATIQNYWFTVWSIAYFSANIGFGAVYPSSWPFVIL